MPRASRNLRRRKSRCIACAVSKRSTEVLPMAVATRRQPIHSWRAIEGPQGRHEGSSTSERTHLAQMRTCGGSCSSARRVSPAVPPVLELGITSKCQHHHSRLKGRHSAHAATAPSLQCSNCGHWDARNGGRTTSTPCMKLGPHREANPTARQGAITQRQAGVARALAASLFERGSSVLRAFVRYWRQG